MKADTSDDPMAAFLTVNKAAETLQVSNPTIYRLINEGQLAALKHGGKSWIQRDEIKDYLARKAAAAARIRAARAKAAQTVAAVIAECR